MERLFLVLAWPWHLYTIWEYAKTDEIDLRSADLSGWSAIVFLILMNLILIAMSYSTFRKKNNNS